MKENTIKVFARGEVNPSLSLSPHLTPVCVFVSGCTHLCAQAKGQLQISESENSGGWGRGILSLRPIWVI